MASRRATTSLLIPTIQQCRRTSTTVTPPIRLTASQVSQAAERLWTTSFPSGICSISSAWLNAKGKLPSLDEYYVDQWPHFRAMLSFHDRDMSREAGLPLYVRALLVDSCSAAPSLERLHEQVLPFGQMPMWWIDARHDVEYAIARRVCQRLAEPGSTLQGSDDLWHQHTATREQMSAAKRKRPERARLPAGLEFGAYDSRLVERFQVSWDPFGRRMCAFVVENDLFPTAIYDRNASSLVAYGSITPWSEIAMGWVDPEWRGRGLFNQIYWRVADCLFDAGDVLIHGCTGGSNDASTKSVGHMGMQAAGHVTRNILYIPAGQGLKPE